MADSLPALLLASLGPSTRKDAEHKLLAFSNQPNFLPSVLQLVLDNSQEKGVRLAASVLFKNAVKRRWDDEESPEYPVAAAEKSLIRAQLVPAMIELAPSKNLRALRLQITNTVQYIAALDFPHEWPDLMSSLVTSLHPTNFLVNNAILETAHAIFAPWRSDIRSDELYTLINLVNAQFLEPFLAMFNSFATTLISAPEPNPDMAQTLAHLLAIFYDLTCQDLPPQIEDAHEAFFGPTTGLFVTFLNWNPPSLIKEDEDDGERSIPNEIKTRIMEILELYVNRFAELMTGEGKLDPFVRAVWNLTSSSTSTSSPGSLPPLSSTSTTSLSAEALISQSLRFLATSIKSGHFTSLFTSASTIERLLEDVILPNIYLREREIEQFEDDPLEYIRADLSSNLTGSSGSAIGGSEGGSGVGRRQASAEVLKAFVGANSEATTNLAIGWIKKGLEAYARKDGREEAWKHKNAAVFLFSAVAGRGWTAQQGVTSTNPLVNVIEFFRDQVYQDLQPGAASHALLTVDAIRFLYSFRNQLTKEQLLSVLPLLIQHLGSQNYVCYTYAAIAIERILGMRKDGLMLFNQADIHDFSTDILTGLFVKIEASGNTPEKIAENDYLMKCIMRVVITSRQSLVPIHAAILTKLIGILGMISKNPSNPLFDQYCFESISALVRFVVSSNPDTLPTFEVALLGPFQVILQQDIEQYVPYVFQILAQLLELQPTAGPTPQTYMSLLPILTTPDVWKQKGSVPGLVRLLKAYLRRDAPSVVATGQLPPMLGVLQQRLIPSKLNDGWGFELLEGIVAYVPTNDLQQYYRSILSMLLQRMQTTPTEKFSYCLAKFLCYAFALKKDGDATWGPDVTVLTVNALQPQPPLFGMVLQHIVLPEMAKSIPKDRKLLAVGLARLLTGSKMLQPGLIEAWAPTFHALEGLFKSGDAITKKSSAEDQTDTLLSAIDQEEQSAGYQAAYSKLAASEILQSDPVEYVSDAKRFFAEELGKAVNQEPGLRKVIAGVGPSGLVNELRGLGVGI